jgi:hypothetical protein
MLKCLLLFLFVHLVKVTTHGQRSETDVLTSVKSHGHSDDELDDGGYDDDDEDDDDDDDDEGDGSDSRDDCPTSNQHHTKKKHRRNRTTFTTFQLHELERAFERSRM